MKKIIIGLLSVMVLYFVGSYVYKMHFNNNLDIISEGKVYKTAAIPPDKIEDFCNKYKIKTVIDLRMPGTNDTILNPEKGEDITAEKLAVEKIKGVQYINIPTPQVPNDETVEKFLEVMDNPDNYPVVIHCTHGTGRAKLFAAIYRIEYEGFTNEEARKQTRGLVKFSSFDHGTPKGEYLKNYVKRRP